MCFAGTKDVHLIVATTQPVLLAVRGTHARFRSTGRGEVTHSSRSATRGVDWGGALGIIRSAATLFVFLEILLVSRAALFFIGFYTV